MMSCLCCSSFKGNCMQESKIEDLLRLCPNLYSHPIFFECGQGWFEIIKGLSEKLEQMIIDGDWEERGLPYAVQVKEKFGSLRFYMSTETDEMSRLIEEYISMSKKICERCGIEGTLRERNRWYSTVCDQCV